MSSIQDPRAKKDASLKKDHRLYPWEGDKSFRGVWKKKKRRLAKQDRASGKEGIRDAAKGDDSTASAKAKRPKALRKTGVLTLKRDLEIKQSEPQLRFTLFDYSCDEFTR
jgi:hypothetical protein